MLRNAISGFVSLRRFDIIERRVPSSEAGGASGWLALAVICASLL